MVYHELEDGGFLELKGTYTLRIRNVPLIETLQRALPEVISIVIIQSMLDYIICIRCTSIDSLANLAL